MTGYEFTKFESNYTCRVKAAKYEASVVAMKCKDAFKGLDYTAHPDYKDAQNWFYETTMSCNNEEVKRWMEYYMCNAIAYGIETKNLDWRTKFLAAYDIFSDLVA